jgi:hypothetical protein
LINTKISKHQHDLKNQIFQGSKNMKLSLTRAFVMVALTITGLIFSAGFAKNTYRLAAIAQLKLSPDTAEGTRLVQCTYCHVNNSGNKPWNPFGINLQSTFRNETDSSLSNTVRIKDAMFKVLAKKLDSDNDGYFDALEVFAKTLPGNEASKPDLEPAKLEVQFKDSGGFAQYKAP